MSALLASRSIRVLCMGYNRQLLAGMQYCLPKGTVTVFEEPDLIRNRSLDKETEDVVGELVPCRYVDSTQAAYQAGQWHQSEPWHAIIPAQEYATVAAADASAVCGLPGAGRLAARVLRDKRLTGALADDVHIPVPRTIEVTAVNDILEMLDDTSQGWILKPADRQASTGVQIVERREDLPKAWERLVSAREGAFELDRHQPRPFLAQERVLGQEISIEVLIADKLVLFVNVTEKTLAPGSAIEAGHLVPGRINAGVEKAIALTRRLASELRFRTGTLHAEWMVTATGPVLIECAGRVAGDSIFELISLAYYHDFYRSLLEVMMGLNPILPDRASRFASITFLSALPEVAGRSDEHQGELGLGDGVVRGRLRRDVRIAKGYSASSSWERLGEAVVVGATAEQALERSATQLRKLELAAFEQYSNEAGR